MCRPAFVELRILGQYTAVSVALHHFVTKIQVPDTGMSDAPPFIIDYIWVDGKHLIFLIVGGVVIEVEGLAGKISGMVDP